jgi:hypothetical protein
MTVNVASKMSRNKLVKDFSGNIIDWYDDKQGGWIIQKRQVVNQEAWNKYLQIQKDKQEAASAIGKQKVDTNAPDRTVVPSKVQELEQKQEAMASKIEEVDTKLDAIIELLRK